MSSVNSVNRKQLFQALSHYSSDEYLASHSLYRALSEFMNRISGEIYIKDSYKSIDAHSLVDFPHHGVNYCRPSGYVSRKNCGYEIGPSSCAEINHVLPYIEKHFVSPSVMLNEIYSFMKPTDERLKSSSWRKDMIATSEMYHRAVKEYADTVNQHDKTIFFTNYSDNHGLSFHLATKADWQKSTHMLVKRIKHNSVIRAQIRKLEVQLYD